MLLGEDFGTVVHDVGDGLHVVTAGAMPPNPSEMLSTPRVAAAIADVAAGYDDVILDSAPVLPVADSVVLARVVDGVLVVTQAMGVGT